MRGLPRRRPCRAGSRDLPYSRSPSSPLDLSEILGSVAAGSALGAFGVLGALGAAGSLALRDFTLTSSAFAWGGMSGAGAMSGLLDSASAAGLGAFLATGALALSVRISGSGLAITWLGSAWDAAGVIAVSSGAGGLSFKAGFAATGVAACRSVSTGFSLSSEASVAARLRRGLGVGLAAGVSGSGEAGSTGVLAFGLAGILIWAVGSLATSSHFSGLAWVSASCGVSAISSGGTRGEARVLPGLRSRSDPQPRWYRADL